MPKRLRWLVELGGWPAVARLFVSHLIENVLGLSLMEMPDRFRDPTGFWVGLGYFLVVPRCPGRGSYCQRLSLFG